MLQDEGLDRLLGALPEHDVPDALIARVLREVEQDGAAPRVESAPPRRWRHAGWAAAAALLVGGAAIGWTGRAPRAALVERGAAASTAPAGIHLGLSLLRDGAPVAFERQARPGDTLLLRYTADRDGFAYLFRRGDDGLEVFSGTPALAGTHHVQQGGKVVGYALRPLRGEQRFGVAWSAEPWPVDDGGHIIVPDGLLGAIEAAPARLDDPELGPLAIDARKVVVEP